MNLDVSNIQLCMICAKLPLNFSFFFSRPRTDHEEVHHLGSLHLQELYYLWRLAGGDVQAELKKQGLIRTMPPILSVPRYRPTDAS